MDLLQIHLNKYLPQWDRSRCHILPPLRTVQLLTVEQATSSGQGRGQRCQASAGCVKCARLGDMTVGHEAACDGGGGAVAVGLLKTNDCGEVILEDSTGKVKCEVRRDSGSQIC